MSESRSQSQYDSSQLLDMIQVMGKNAGLEKMLEQKISLNVHSSDSGETLLMLAIVQGRTDLVSQLLKARADFNAQDKDGMTPLHYCALNKRNAAASLLIKAKADVDAKSHRKETPLHFAVEKSLRITRQLLTARADVNAKIRGSCDITALHLAARNHSIAIVDVLLEAKANVNQASYFNSYPLHDCAERDKNPEIAARLLAAKADVNAVDVRGMAPLHAAVQGDADSILLVRCLLEAKANPNMQDMRDVTPLHHCVRNDRPQMAKLLIKAKADVNAQNLDRWTPIHTAVYTGRNTPELFYQLLRAGANFYVPDIRFRTPLHFINRNPRQACSIEAQKQRLEKNMLLFPLLYSFVAGILPRTGRNSCVLEFSNRLLFDVNLLKLILRLSVELPSDKSKSSSASKLEVQETQLAENKQQVGLSPVRRGSLGFFPTPRASSADKNKEPVLAYDSAGMVLN